MSKAVRQDSLATEWEVTRTGLHLRSNPKNPRLRREWRREEAGVREGGKREERGVIVRAGKDVEEVEKSKRLEQRRHGEMS